MRIDKRHQPPCSLHDPLRRSGFSNSPASSLKRRITLKADAATVLNVSEDHLDRYSGEWMITPPPRRVSSKGEGVMVLNRDDDRSLAPAAAAEKWSPLVSTRHRARSITVWPTAALRGNEMLIALNELKLSGLHNAANAMAALALCEAIGVAPHSLLPALNSFAGLPHRVEFVAEIKGVSYYRRLQGNQCRRDPGRHRRGWAARWPSFLVAKARRRTSRRSAGCLTKHGRAVALIGRDAATDRCGY